MDTSIIRTLQHGPKTVRIKGFYCTEDFVQQYNKYGVSLYIYIYIYIYIFIHGEFAQQYGKCGGLMYVPYAQKPH